MFANHSVSADIDIGRMWRRLEDLSAFTDAARPWTRRAFSSEFFAARKWLEKQMLQAGLTVHIDAGGNLIGRLDGTVPDAAPIMTGSHTDTVFEGGRYDGIIGVLAGIEIAQTLNAQGIRLRHPFEVVDFLSEEPSDFGVSCVGSRAMAGLLSPEMLAQKSPSGQTLSAAIHSAGGRPQDLGQAIRAQGSLHAFVELHIEQGPVLEREQIPIGVVTDLVGIRRYRIVISGQADHSGTTPMDYRKDALVGASLLVLATHNKAKLLNSDAVYAVSTVGYLNVLPNSSNAVPASVELMLEIRSNNSAVLESYGDELFTQTLPDLTAAGLTMDTTSVSYGEPTLFNPAVVSLIDDAAKDLGYMSLRMPSGAGHDAAYLSKITPSGMIFIPCLNGRSHCPEESIEPEQLKKGLQVLLGSILKLDAVACLAE